MSLPGRTLIVATLVGALLLAACGPDTIFVRPGLDTPEQHVANGNKLLERGKLDAAHQEFQRARELDSEFVAAYIGLSLVACQQGEVTEGRQLMQRAAALAETDEEKAQVDKGLAQLEETCGAP